MTNRLGGRRADQLREMSITRHYTRHAEGSVLVECGEPACCAPLRSREGVRGSSKARARAGSPRNTACCHAPRTPVAGREAAEGKQTRADAGNPAPDRPLAARGVRLGAAGRTNDPVDCDVLQADGGTRLRVDHRRLRGAARRRDGCRPPGLSLTSAAEELVAAVSVGIVEGTPMLDLDYVEDSGLRHRHERRR